MLQLFKESILTLTSVFILSSCGQPKATNSDKPYHIMNAKETAVALVTDDSEAFFKKVMPIDVAIQLKNNSLLTDKNYVETYKQVLRKSAVDFEKDEALAMRESADRAIKMIQKINPKLPTPFSIGKILPNHYGDNVYYTRGKAIFIPANTLNPYKSEEQLTILLHEIWHVLAEARPDLKASMYKLIGFKRHQKKINYPVNLKRRLLANPDGVHDEFAIDLGGKLALPVILSKRSSYADSEPLFFNYLQFELFGLNDDGTLDVNTDLTNNLTPDQQASFFKLIKENTQYIIHPDEIIADNFMLGVLAYNSNDFSKFNNEGKKLIDEIIILLKKE